MTHATVKLTPAELLKFDQWFVLYTAKMGEQYAADLLDPCFDAFKAAIAIERAAPKQFMVGQRVIVDGRIVTICRDCESLVPGKYIEYCKPYSTYVHTVEAIDVKPLPGGQL